MKPQDITEVTTTHNEETTGHNEETTPHNDNYYSFKIFPRF